MPTGRKPSPGKLAQHIAGVLRAEVARRRISQTQLAEMTGISQSQVSKYLAGKKTPTGDEYEALCAVIGRRYFDVHAEAERHAIEALDITPAERADLMASMERAIIIARGGQTNGDRRRYDTG